MLPLSFATVGEECTITSVGGTPEMKKHLEDMGFTVGGKVTVMSRNGGNIIVSVKDTRVALDESLANKIKI